VASTTWRRPLAAVQRRWLWCSRRRSDSWIAGERFTTTAVDQCEYTARAVKRRRSLSFLRDPKHMTSVRGTQDLLCSYEQLVCEKHFYYYYYYCIFFIQILNNILSIPKQKVNCAWSQENTNYIACGGSGSSRHHRIWFDFHAISLLLLFLSFLTF
jgi:hypothetical protein